MCAVRAIPEGYHTITPSIVCKNASKAIELYKGVLGAVELARMEGPGGTVAHAELKIGDSVLMISDEFPGMSHAPQPGTASGNYLFIYSENVDALFDRAVKAGCQVEIPLSNQFWGDRYGKVRDPFGHTWGFGQHVEDVSLEEMKKRSEAWMANMSKSAGQS